MAPESDRRGFFGAFLREVAGIAREVDTAIRTSFEEPTIDEPEAWYESRPIPAHPTSRTVSRDELALLCDQHGLAKRRDDVLALAAPSLRLTRAPEPQAGSESSHLGGIPNLPSKFVWPSRNGTDLDFLGQLDLAEVAASIPDAVGSLALPPSGLLLFFHNLTKPSGLSADPSESSQVVYVDDSRTGEPAPAPEGRAVLPHYALEMSWELTLPRSWSISVEHLELNGAEAAAWDALREQLAHSQGVDLEELRPEWQSLHRLLGYPDELGSDLELDCELAEADIGDEDEHQSDAHSPESVTAPSNWRLLLQLSDDDGLGLSLGDGFSRLYFLIHWSRLGARDFASSRTILR